ncbi:MAG: alkaline phosphatase family protein [Candidatus Aminicenantes bacterium]|nr:alkaline phosphatase family protein [Candidatus Aminicenantes bacterium]
MASIKKKIKNRVCVIGLDGVPFGLLEHLARTGVMSALGRIIDSGRLHKMKASLPEISSVSWTNFMTGTNPGTHGIFGFTDFKPRSYELRFPNYNDVKVPPFWDVLAEKGVRSIIINQPSTYPARRLNGAMISGFVALDLGKAVWPPELKGSLEQMGYQIDIDTVKARGNPAFLWQDLIKTFMSRQKAMNIFWEDEWDYFEFVLTGTDRLHHFLWNAGLDPRHPQHQNFLEYYRQIDRLISKIYSAFRKTPADEENIFFLSDHGFTGIIQEVYLNAWLEKEKYLRFNKSQPGGFEDVSARTKAFALDPNRIYIHHVKRFPNGRILAAEAKVLKEEITRRLEKLEFEGKKVVHKVFDTKEIYSGPYAVMGPDLIVVPEPGFDMKGSIKRREIFGRSPGLQGMHTWNDAFFLAKNDFGSDLQISDLAKIISDRF